MNILILVNPAKNYKTFFYGLANALEELGHKVFYAYDSKKNTIVNPIPEIDNSCNSFFFDEYLKNNSSEVTQLDSKQEYLFNCSWGEFYYSDFDRFLTHDYNIGRRSLFWMDVRRCLDSFFYKLISENNIDFVLYENISNSFEYSAYRICQKLQKKYFGLMASRIPGRYEIQTSIIEEELNQIEANKICPPSQEEIVWFKNYKEKIINIEPDYMKQNGLDDITIKKNLKFSAVQKIYRSIVADIKYSNKYDYSSGGLFKRLISSIKVAFSRRVNEFRSRSFYMSLKEIDDLKEIENFYVYPMHYHPESSTSVLAPEYTDEFHNILHIHNNLPFGDFLYVKDHRSAIGLHNLKFYKKITTLPGVRLVPANYNIKKLIKSSKGVITVNSTAGYEALLLEKPVYLLGSVFYQNFANVFSLENFSSIKKLVQNKMPLVDNQMDFIAYRRSTFEGGLNFNISNLTDNQNYFLKLAHDIQEKYKK